MFNACCSCGNIAPGASEIAVNEGYGVSITAPDTTPPGFSPYSLSNTAHHKGDEPVAGQEDAVLEEEDAVLEEEDSYASTRHVALDVVNGKRGTGIKVLGNHSMCVVRHVTDGRSPIQMWNAANPDSNILAGDVILEVNGLKDIDEIRAALKIPGPCNILAMRPPQLSCAIDSQVGKCLGLQLRRFKDCEFCVVEEILPHGLVAEWNLSHPEQTVKAGFLLLSVNGVCTRDAFVKNLVKDLQLNLVLNILT
eukprot:NODE_16360_length_998_cov_14.884041.p1 GENE.NODE_16360_length_998_cov_14.884041~~NODE_16360_length_998_cov_14.884041.p1  ORF type:complete len:251 (-),score=50.88 NODE_16360_length_998_cov_14.884041:213-965(-)